MDLSEAQAHYDAAAAAYRQALAARSVGTAGRTISYQEINKLREEMMVWSRMVKNLTAGSASNYSVARWQR